MELALLSIVTVAYFIFAYSAVRKNPKNHTSILFALLSILFGLWAISNYFSLNTKDSELITTLWVRVVLFVTAPLFGTLALLAHTFPEEKIKASKMFLVFHFILTGIVMLIVTTPLAMNRVEIDDSGNFNPFPGPGIGAYGGYMIYSLILTFIFSIRKYRQSNPIQKSQIQYLFTGLGITLGFALITNFLLVNVFQNASFVAFGPLFGIIFIVFTSYAIRRFQLFDLRYLLNQAIIVLILILFLEITFYAVYFLHVLLWGGIFTTEAYLSGLVVAFLFLNLFTFVRERVTRFVDKDLLRGDYDIDEIFTSMTDKISVAIDTHKLSEEIAGTLFEKMGIERVEFTIIETSKKNTNEIISTYSKTVQQFEHSDTINFENINVQRIALDIKKADSYLLEELDYVTDSEIYSELIKKKYQVIITIPTTEKTYGILLLGSKITGNPFTFRDINFFSSISKPISLSIQRALLYLEVQQFSQKLQKEVDIATADLRAANERLKEVDSLKDDLISIAGHELRTPATVITNNLYLLEQNINKKDKRVIYIDRLKEGIRREIEMISNLLEAARLGKKQIKLQPINFDIFTVVKQATEEFKYLAKEKSLTIEIVSADDKQEIDKIQKSGFLLEPHHHFVKDEAFTEADKTRIREVIDNLITNSIKYTEKGGIKIWLTEGKDSIGVYVKDTGIGIRPEEQAKLFQKFSRVESRNESGLVRPGGTGLGLYVAKNIMQMHAGDLKVESKGVKGEGSLFFFTLPKKFKGIVKQSESSSST